MTNDQMIATVILGSLKGKVNMSERIFDVTFEVFGTDVIMKATTPVVGEKPITLQVHLIIVTDEQKHMEEQIKLHPELETK